MHIFWTSCVPSKQLECTYFALPLSHKNKQNSRTIANWRGCQKGPDGDISAGCRPVATFPGWPVARMGQGSLDHLWAADSGVQKKNILHEKHLLPLLSSSRRLTSKYATLLLKDARSLDLYRKAKLLHTFGHQYKSINWFNDSMCNIFSFCAPLTINIIFYFVVCRVGRKKGNTQKQTNFGRSWSKSMVQNWV